MPLFLPQIRHTGLPDPRATRDTSPLGHKLRPHPVLQGIFADEVGTIWSSVRRGTYCNPHDFLRPLPAHVQGHMMAVNVTVDRRTCDFAPRPAVVSRLVLECWIGPAHGRHGRHYEAWYTHTATPDRRPATEQDNSILNLWWSAARPDDDITVYLGTPAWTRSLFDRPHPGFKHLPVPLSGGRLKAVPKPRAGMTLFERYLEVGHPQALAWAEEKSQRRS